MLQHFFIEGQYLGAAERRMQFVHAQLSVPTSYWFLCPVCGDLWAKAVVDSKNGNWQPAIHCCPKHGHASIWRPWDAEYTEALPFQVLLWEVKQELKRYDKENA